MIQNKKKSSSWLFPALNTSRHFPACNSLPLSRLAHGPMLPVSILNLCCSSGRFQRPCGGPGLPTASQDKGKSFFVLIYVSQVSVWNIPASGISDFCGYALVSAVFQPVMVQVGSVPDPVSYMWRHPFRLREAPMCPSCPHYVNQYFLDILNRSSYFPSLRKAVSYQNTEREYFSRIRVESKFY